MVNISLFNRLVPLKALLPADRTQLAKQSSVLQYQPGQAMFRDGELARTHAYLIEGSVELTNDQGLRVLHAEDADAVHPLAPGPRRSAAGRALTAAKVLYVDREQLDVFLTWTQAGEMEVSEIGAEADDADSHDWMTALLQSKAFLRIPPANIAQIFSSMEPVAIAAGETILRQGEPGDYYYVVTEGRCQVVLESPDGMEEEELAQLGVGRCFGEEALVSGEPRNATVRALTRCNLMRLSSSAFNRLLKAPLLDEVTLDELPEGAVLVDVRLPAEFMAGHLPGAINLPLNHLRKLADSLQAGGSYWIYCDTGRRSASAAFLLSERGFDAHLIRGGVSPERFR
ncbi:MAG: cyclic nucleotide-binding domain-containing protein [Xanthomonadales bacterium]|nr:cyclic nucleotide-binding domain-containing protein [Xanthomonadales bacterium]